MDIFHSISGLWSPGSSACILGRGWRLQGCPMGGAEIQEELDDAELYSTLRSLLGGSDKKAAALFAPLAGCGKEKRIAAETAAAGLGIGRADFSAEFGRISAAYRLLPAGSRCIGSGRPAYPERLRAAGRTPAFLFILGRLNLITTNIISIIGTRTPDRDGMRLAADCALALSGAGITVASGLARGIDSAALRACLDAGYPCVAVIGTPLNRVYPPENARLQEAIAQSGLLISPFSPDQTVRRWFFPRRDAVMSGISLGSLIAEAGEKSGALIQAEFARRQGRLVLIPRSAMEDPGLCWPEAYQGAEETLVFGSAAELIDMLRSRMAESAARTQPELFPRSQLKP